MNRIDKSASLSTPKVSEGAAPPVEEIPRKRGSARPGSAADQVGNGKGSVPEKMTRKSRSKHDGEENNQEHGNRVYANILTKKKQS